MNTTPLNLIRKRHRQALWMPTVWTTVAGLVVLLIIGKWFSPADNGQKLLLWSEGLGIIALAAALVRLRSQHTHQTIARTLDAELTTFNRIEAAAELAHRNDPLAEAQRHNTTEFLSTNRPPPSWLWPTGLALLSFFCVATLFNFSITSYRLATATSEAKAAADKAALADKDGKDREKEKLKTAKAEPPPATLNWISPKAESTGTPIEEIPLTAEAESVTGLKNVTLLVTVNGEAKPVVKLPADVAKGKQPINLSIYLDELGVQPFDMVSYYLQADRVVPEGIALETPWPQVTSTLQFLQVRPLKDDTQLQPPQPPSQAPSPSQVVNMLRKLKLVQIDLMRDTFALANDNPPQTDAAWPELNFSASLAQTALADRTQQAVDLANQNGAPAEIVNLLTQAKEHMYAASTSLTKPDPTAAQTSQGQALGELTAVEKYFVKVISQNQGQKPPPPPDPFDVNQPYKLPPREQTPAGQLEQLAQQQTQLANQLADANSTPTTGSSPGSSPGASPNPGSTPGATPGASPGSNPGSGPGSGPGAGQGSGAGSGLGSGSGGAGAKPSSNPAKPSESSQLADMAKQQQKIVDGINSLNSAGQLPPDAAPALQNAIAASQESALQLAKNDAQAAVEPALRAATSLRDAVNRVNAASKANTSSTLADAQRALNQSASNVAGATPGTSPGAAKDAAQTVAQAEAALRAAADQQQKTGSTDAAQQLADLANAITDSHVQNDLKKLTDAGPAATDGDRLAAADKLLTLAQGAANGQGALGNRDQLAAQALDALKRDRVNLDRADQAGPDALHGLQSDVIAQAQVAQAANQGATQINNDAPHQGDGKRANTPVEGPILMLAPPAPPAGNEQHAPFMRMMGSQIDSLISLIAKENATGRPHVLTTAQTGDAPPAYRPAVADYFESLAHEQAPAPAPAQP